MMEVIVYRLCLHCESGSSHGKTSRVLQNSIQFAADNLMFIDFPAILMMKCKHYVVIFYFCQRPSPLLFRTYAI